jgi:putative tricarboxylic transport membrane protein
MTATKLVTRARLEGLVILALALGYLWQARSIPSLYQMPGVPGPTAFPTLVGLVLAACGAWRLVRGAGRGEPAAEEPAAAPAAGGGGFLAGGGRFYAMWAVLLGYLALMPVLGFPVATVPALAILFVLLGERRLAVAAGLSLAATAVLHLGFAKGLGVQLPLGVLGSLVK